MDAKIKEFYEEQYGKEITQAMTIAELGSAALMHDAPGSPINMGTLHTVCPPYLLPSMQKLYGMDVKTVSCGIDEDNMGISCNYETLNPQNKAIVDTLIAAGELKQEYTLSKSPLIRKTYGMFLRQFNIPREGWQELPKEALEHPKCPKELKTKCFRIGIHYDENISLEQASSAMLAKIDSLGLSAQEKAKIVFNVKGQ